MPEPSRFRIVLLGVGHTNAFVLEQWRRRPIVDAQLTCVSDFDRATYSGMLPGTLAGDYRPEQMQIDLVRLCAASGAELIRNEAIGMDAGNRRLLFAGRPPLAFDALSVGIGSRPTTAPGPEGLVIAIKPMQTFLDRLDTRLAWLAEQVPDRPWRIVVAGGGAAGFEVACCLPNRLRRFRRSDSGAAPWELTIVSRGDEILPGMPRRTVALARRELERRGVGLVLGRGVVGFDERRRVVLDDGDRFEADLLLGATAARAPELLGRLGLPVDERGFLLTRDTLQSVASDAVLAVGDSGTLRDSPLPKAGVYAVRQGPALWDNLRRLARGEAPRRWRPQAGFLTLLNTGDRRAILTYRGLSLHSRGAWRLKDLIDRRFIAKYQRSV